MQAKSDELSGFKLFVAKTTWKVMAKITVLGVRLLAWAGLHKQWANRPIEWCTPITVLVTSTEWDNFFNLRIHPNAQPEIAYLAKEIKHMLHDVFTPRVLKHGEWHLPFIDEKEKCYKSIDELKVMSAARCARVSYLNFKDTPSSYEEDKKLFDKLIGDVNDPIHASCFEHQAIPATDRNYNRRMRNFKYFIQQRVFIEESKYGNKHSK